MHAMRAIMVSPNEENNEGKEMATTVKIIETGETKELSLIDPKTGLDCSSDLLGNFDAFDGYDDENDTKLMSQENFEWWSELLPEYEAASIAVEEHRKSLDDDTDFLEHLNHATGCDLDMQPTAMLDAIQWSKDRANA